MFDSLLIANRGEIACRIIATCRRMGIRSVAVYSASDANALHVRMADAAVAIGPAAARESYLRADRIVEAALASGAQAIHPGYGFLSERLDLIAACDANGLVFIGPNAGAIDAMGDKIRSKQIAREAGVPGVPGYDGADQAPAMLRAEALRVGLPVMVKASAGGGGKGIRKVEREDELDNAIATAAAEAKAAFGDGRLLIEKFVTRPRHVEVQVAGDRHGNLVHLFERDCSVQRANQKLLEEAPAPNLRPETRAALHAHALTLARAIGYDNLGTVEFLVDAGSEEIAFLEMNTRLQVEHPVTEAITGLDLVEWQIRIAAGEALPLAQDAITCTGHAIEARLTAEKPEDGFQPDAGTICLWRAPDGVRTDAGIATGSEVTPHYDSLLAKLIAHDTTRDGARRRLARALDETVVLGPATNRAFLADALRADAFAQGAATTLFLRETWPEGWRPRLGDEALRDAIAAALWLAPTEPPETPWQGLRGFRLLAPSGHPAVTHLAIGVADATRTVKVAWNGRTLHVGEGLARHAVELCDVRAGTARVIVVDGCRLRCEAVRVADGIQLSMPGFEGRVAVALAVDAAAASRAGAAIGGDGVRAPMPGTIASLAVERGQQVEAGAVVGVLESMKLFIDLKSPLAGTVGELAARPGQSVAAGDLLMRIEAP